MKKEHVLLRRNRDVSAGHLMATIRDLTLHQLKVEQTRSAMLRAQVPRSHFEDAMALSIRLSRRQKTEQRTFDANQTAWQLVLKSMDEYEVGDVLDCALDDFVFDWPAIDAPFELGQHLDAIEIKWGHLKTGYIETTPENLNEAIQNLVSAGASEESLAQMYSEVWPMGEALGSREYQWACYLAIGLMWQAQNITGKTTGLIRETVPAFHAATAAYQNARMDACDVILKASRSTSEG